MALIQYRNRSNDSFPEIFSDDFLRSFFPGVEKSLSQGASQWFAALDVSEDKNGYTIQVDVPGLKKEDVHVSFDNGVLTIEGERTKEAEQKDKNYHRTERNYGKFVRSLSLGTGVDGQDIKANYKDGVLTITVPKSEKAKPKAIDINVG